MATPTQERVGSVGRDRSGGLVEILRSAATAVKATPPFGRERYDFYWFAAAAALALGAAIRIAGYLSRWPLFLDDARLAIDIASRTPLQLLRPLDFEQSAPLALLWTDWGLTQVFGVSEYVWRAVPLLTGVLLLGLLWHLGRTLFGERQGAFAAMIGAGSGLLILYGAYSVKPYGSDAFVTAALLACAVPVVRDPTKRRAWLRLGIAGILGEWASEPAIFVLAGIGLAALVALAQTSERGRATPLAVGTGAVWVGCFVALYAVLYRPVALNPYMVRYWGAAFTEAPPSAVRYWLLTAYRAWVLPIAVEPAHRLGSAKLAIAAVTVGITFISTRRGLRWGALLAGPYLALLVAVMLHLYPPAYRLVLFSAPCMFLVVAELMARGIDLTPRAGRGLLAAMLLVVLAAHAVLFGSVTAGVFQAREDSRPLVEQLQRGHSGEPVYLMARAVPQWVFYTTNWRNPDRSRLAWVAQVTAASSGSAYENARSRGRAVRREGDTLTDVYAGRRELIGLGSGLEQMLWPSPSSRIDSGWADNEVRRMRAVAAPSVWLFAAHYRFEGQEPPGVELLVLLDAAKRGGAGVVYSDVESNAALYELDFSRWHQGSDSLPTNQKALDVGP